MPTGPKGEEAPRRRDRQRRQSRAGIATGEEPEDYGPHDGKDPRGAKALGKEGEGRLEGLRALSESARS